MKIAELPFFERPVIELLHLENPGEVDTDYAGFGWSRVDRIWLATPGETESETESESETPVDDALVLGIHSLDDGTRFHHDIELEFELAPARSITVLATNFLKIWLPKLPRASAIVLAMCNPHDARLAVPTDVPLHYGLGDVDSWLADDDLGTRIKLVAPSWCTLSP